MFVSTLPPSASKRERVLEQIFWEEMGTIERDIKDFLDPSLCRLDLLPYLAWELSVDGWDDNWSEQTKRIVCKRSLEIHRYKGTKYAIDKSIEAIRTEHVRVIEYFEDPDNLRPGFFRVDLLVNNADVDATTVPSIRKAVMSAKNCRSHLESIAITCQSHANVGVQIISRIGGIIRSNPWIHKQITCEGLIFPCCYLRLGMVIRSSPIPLNLEY